MSFPESSHFADRRQIDLRKSTIDQACQLIHQLASEIPKTAVILGSGLGGIADKIETPVEIGFEKIPGFLAPTTGGHRGQFILGRLQRSPVIAMAGRYHVYEGWSVEQVVFPVEVMAALGVKRLIISNAAGGVNPKLRVGDIVVIREHLNRIPGARSVLGQPVCPTPFRQPQVYDPQMARIAMQTSLREGFHAYEGTYLATTGPTYETRAEYRMMRRLGADVVGMSTVPEALVAAEHGIKVLGLSMVSNVASPDTAIKTDHQEVLDAGKAAACRMESIVHAVLCHE